MLQHKETLLQIFVNEKVSFMRKNYEMAFLSHFVGELW